MPPWVTPSISTVNRLCWLKSPAVFLVVPLRTSRLNFTGIHLLLCDPRGGRALRSGGDHSAPGFHFTLSGPLPDPPTRSAGGHHRAGVPVKIMRPGGGGRARPRDAPSVTSLALPSGRC